jgi:septal ring factor EnvC (AmiA/AmiB activator)
MVMPGQITRREVIVDALGKHGRNVILSDDLLKDDLLMENLGTACEFAGGSCIQPGNGRFAQRTMSLEHSRRRAAPLWIAAALLAATWMSETQAASEGQHAQAVGLVSARHATAARDVVLAGDYDFETVRASRFGDRSMRLAQTVTGTPTEPQAGEAQDHQNAEVLARELAAARHDLELLLKLLNKARDEQARAKQAADREAAELRKALQEERGRTTRANQEMDSGASELLMLRDQAARMEQDLAAMRRNVEPQTATRTVDEASPANQPANAGLADLRKSLQLERDRASKLEQDLAAARRDVETQTALAAKVGDEAARTQAESGGSDLQKSLQQEHARAERLEQDLAAARRDVETQTALATKASAEAAQAKQAAESGPGEVQKSLQEEHARAGQLEQDLAASRRDLETMTAAVIKSSIAAARAKQAAESRAAELQESMQQEHARADKLERDLAAARRDVEAKAVLTMRASAAARARRAAESGADLQTTMQQERARANQLEQDLAAARRDVESKAVLVIKASAAAARAKRAAESGADLRKSLQQARDRADQLEQDLAVARRDVETKIALVIKASDAAARAKQAAESSGSELQKSLQQEHARADQLEKDLAAARRDVETQTALATKASDEAARLKQAADNSAGDLQKSLQQERDRVGRLEQDLAAARRDVETRTAMVIRASAIAAQAKQAAESGAGELQKSLQQERDRAGRLEQELAAARRDVETQTALAAKASDEAAQVKQAAERDAGELQKSVQQNHARAEQLEQDLAVARRDVESKTALAAKAGDEVARVKQAAQRIVGELQKSLQQERDQRERLERNLASADHAKDAPVPPEAVTVGHTTQDKPPDTVAKPND